ncbi:Unknown protein, partial [Striga hermonthica]
QPAPANRLPVCGTCGCAHRGECLAGQNVCYNCKKPGHMTKECPDRQQPQPQAQPQQQRRAGQQVQVYFVDQAQAEENPGTMSGMIILNDIHIFALFDTGASHSFVSKRCIEAIGVQLLDTVDPLEVSLASGQKIVTSSKAENLRLNIGGRILERMNAPNFAGTENPTAVLEWIKELDKIFTVLPLPDRQRVSLAAYQMKEDASDWWIDHWARRPEAELHALTWEQIKMMVRRKFLPKSFWDRMEHEFYHLQQGSSTVDEYVRTFTCMCLFA